MVSHFSGKELYYVLTQTHQLVILCTPPDPVCPGSVVNLEGSAVTDEPKTGTGPMTETKSGQCE